MLSFQTRNSTNRHKPCCTFIIIRRKKQIRKWYFFPSKKLGIWSITHWGHIITMWWYTNRTYLFSESNWTLELHQSYVEIPLSKLSHIIRMLYFLKIFRLIVVMKLMLMSIKNSVFPRITTTTWDIFRVILAVSSANLLCMPKCAFSLCVFMLFKDKAMNGCL